VPVQRVKKHTDSMPHDEACEARLKFILPPPTDEELATMMELKAEKAKLLKTRSAYTCLINYLHNEFQQIYKEDFNLARRMTICVLNL